MTESYQDIPEELRYRTSLILSPQRLLEVIKQRREYFDEKIVFRPIDDRGGPVSVYSGPSGPTVTLGKVMKNVGQGKPAGEGIPPGALNDPNSP
ncbi:hypothetical protein KW801_03615 [Candidatus Saccharibacteria bacterium]|nr:hypothetical protein [Candidatus Saccharibacteria bacterium]